MQEPDWLPQIQKGAKPIYLAIADAIAEDIRSGRLASGVKLPPQRQLAERLGFDFTTVSRAYAEAQRRGLVVGRVGQGTFVRPGAAPATGGQRHALIDMSMNAPPLPEDPNLVERLRAGMADMARQWDLRSLMGYGDAAGSPEDRAAGVQWLAARLPNLSPDRLQVCPGAQGAMLAVLSTLAREGEVICTEALTYPGIKALAAQLGLRLHGLPMDRGGIDPEAFRTACRELKPKALYCNPTLQNPTTLTLSLERRQALVAVAREFHVPIIEDDAYGMLPLSSPPPLAALAPELVYHVAGLAKCLAPALRIAYLVAPDSRQAIRLAAALRATALMASPLSAGLASRWITDGTAQALLGAIRDGARLRQGLAAKLLPAGSYDGHPEAFHLWLRLPKDWSRAEFTATLRGQGLAVAGADAFAVTQPPPEAVRICLGTLGSRDEAGQALSVIADLLNQAPSINSAIV